MASCVVQVPMMVRASVFICCLALAACGPRPASCRTDADCAAGTVCERYFCVPESDGGDSITDDAGPEDGGSTVDAGPEDGGMVCVTHADCPSPQKCSGQRCTGAAPDAGASDAGADDAGAADSGVAADAGIVCHANETCPPPLTCRGNVCR